MNVTLVLSGTGKTGRRVVERLSARGMRVRVGSRSFVPPFDWNDPETWTPALRNVTSVYVAYSPDLTWPGAAKTIASFVDLAVDQGVRKLVLLSGRGEPEAYRSEHTVQASGVDWTIVRAGWFNQTVDLLTDLITTVLDGRNAYLADGVQRALGRAPKDFTDYARDAAASGAWTA